MVQKHTSYLGDLDEALLLRSIIEGTASETGERFFDSLVENLCKALKPKGAWVTEYIEDSRKLRALSFILDGEWIKDFEYPIDGTVCMQVIEEKRLIHYPDNVLVIEDKDHPLRDFLKNFGPISFLGVPLMDTDRHVMGHLAILDTKPLPEDEKIIGVFNIFAARARAELRRLRAEKEVREKQEKLSRIVNSAMDGIVELDSKLFITMVNSSVENILRRTSRQLVNKNFNIFLTEESSTRLMSLIEQLFLLPPNQRYQWIPGGLKIVAGGENQFHAEATISCYEMKNRNFFTLILRNVEDRIRAEERINSLTSETEYLKEQIRELNYFDEIIGKSTAMLRVLKDVAEVAETDTTVLLTGETGTGKEVIARAIHNYSSRNKKPLISVNCAAIPQNLIESEFFGHEQGAFTGATKKREGRFSLADGGTIFLDEIGELPLDLQPKLLRVLQEGEFDPVGSSRTKKVDVRIIAATNRNLKKAVEEGKFREDLYYRLNVFPIMIPPLREREDDVILLAEAFSEKYSKRIGRKIEKIPLNTKNKLRAYSWPGNVRELQNVIERGIITSRDGHINIDRALPDVINKKFENVTVNSATSGAAVLTVEEINDLERKNIMLALESARWQIYGDSGAAILLGMNPSTLRSRIKNLGIKKPG